MIVCDRCRTKLPSDTGFSDVNLARATNNTRAGLSPTYNAKMHLCEECIKNLKSLLIKTVADFKREKETTAPPVPPEQGALAS